MVRESRTKKIGDIAGIQLKDSKGRVWKLFIEIKHSEDKSYLNKGLDKFLGNYENWDAESNGNAIFVFLSYRTVGLDTKPKVDEKKRFIVIDGIKKEDFSVDIESLSFPEKLKIDDVISKLHFPQTLTGTILIYFFFQFNYIFECKIYFNHFILFFNRKNENLGQIRK